MRFFRSPKPLIEVIEEGTPSSPPVSSLSVMENLDVTIDSNKSAHHHPQNPFPQVESSLELVTTSSSDPQGACHISPRAQSGIIQQKYITSNKLQETIMESAKLSPKRPDREKQGSKQWPNRWTCPSCCTLNWMNSSSCKQCNTKFNSQCLNGPTELDDEVYTPKAQEPLKISELAEFGTYKETTKRPACSPAVSPNKVNTLPKGAEKYSSRSHSPNNANQDKWTCPVCTYDNWPRSVKCIMCMCPILGDQAMSVAPNQVSNGSLYPQTNLCMDPVITPSLANLSLGVSNRSPSFETSSFENSAVNTNYADSMRMRLFRGSEMDRRWLDACCGVVEGNVQPVEEYLSSGGDPTRQLTEAEVLHLNRPSAFDIGFTLIHLALR